MYVMMKKKNALANYLRAVADAFGSIKTDNCY